MSRECCSCGGGGGPVIIKCGSAAPDVSDGGGATPGGPGPGPGPGPVDPEPPAGPPCQIVAVRFHSVRVREAAGVEILFVGEQPENWELTLTANDQSVTVPISARDGADISIEEEFDIELPSASSTISVRSSGKAIVLVGGFFDQNLPSTENSHGASDNWGLDSQLNLGAANGDRSYTVFYSIKCQTKRKSSLISRKQAIEVIHEALAPSMDSKKVPDDLALNLFIRRMESAGYQLRELQPDILVWEGRQDIHRTVQRLLKRHREKRLVK